MHDVPEAQVGGFPVLDYAPPASMTHIKALDATLVSPEH